MKLLIATTLLIVFLFAMGVVVQLLSNYKRRKRMAMYDWIESDLMALTGLTSYTAGNTSQSSNTYQMTANAMYNPNWAYVPQNGYSFASSGISFGTSQPWDIQDNTLWPFNSGKLSEEEKKLISDFKLRNPDFDDYDTEIGLVLEQFPNMKDSPIYMTLLYDLGKKIRELIKTYVKEEKNKMDETSSEL